jgi:hypothetical protein
VLISRPGFGPLKPGCDRGRAGGPDNRAGAGDRRGAARTHAEGDRLGKGERGTHHRLDRRQQPLTGIQPRARGEVEEREREVAARERENEGEGAHKERWAWARASGPGWATSWADYSLLALACF